MKSLCRKSLFGILLGYGIILCGLIYWQVFVDFADHPKNPRHYAVFSQPRGSIYDRNSHVLAETIQDEDITRRVYGTPSLSHVVGYFHRRYGIAGLEHAWFDQLNAGRDILTTIDLALQQKIEELFGDRVGAVVVIKPTTGEILAMLSSPYLDSNNLDTNWADYRSDMRSPFMNRATQGRYPPGSVIKPIVLCAALERGITSPDQNWIDQGKIAVSNRVINNFQEQRFGNITTNQALAVSSNVVFAQLAITLGDELLEYYRRVGFGSSFDLDIATAAGNVPTERFSDYGFAQLGIGQGELLVTPLQMAVVVAAIANRGIAMQPYIVREVRGGFPPRQVRRPRTTGQVVPERIAGMVRGAMVLAVENGTAHSARIPNVSIAGKTGTAENPHGDDHSWFVGFAPAQDPEVAVVVLVEHGGTGSSNAAPIGGKVLQAALGSFNSKASLER